MLSMHALNEVNSTRSAINIYYCNICLFRMPISDCFGLGLPNIITLGPIAQFGGDSSSGSSIRLNGTVNNQFM